MLYVALNEHITNPPLSRNFRKYIQVTNYNVQPIFFSLEFPKQNKISSPSPKMLVNRLRKGEITAINKGKNIQIEPMKRRWSTYESSTEKAYIRYCFPVTALSWRTLKKVMRKQLPANLLSKDVLQKGIEKSLSTQPTRIPKRDESHSMRPHFRALSI